MEPTYIETLVSVGDVYVCHLCGMDIEVGEEVTEVEYGSDRMPLRYHPECWGEEELSQ